MPKGPGSVRSRRTRIFIIGEYAIYREALRRLLEVEDDFSVVGAAADCLDALELVEKYRPDVVLLDLAAPVLPKIDTLLKFFGVRAAARIIVIVPSIAGSVLTDALRSGVRGILPKTAPAAQLPMSIRTVLSGQYWIEREMLADLVETLCAPVPGLSLTAAGQRFGLTNREIDVVSLVIVGFANKQIADRCSIAERTVKHHLTKIFGKLGVSSRLELALFALHHQLVALDHQDHPPSLPA
ncbi:MAG: hypothetical protein AUH72_05520 [Acidobacteria bacterium 13_1_40CM_4_65_8]|nr:MAG: hypothetical protein AUH72_05520 [Acidobacteria bacterium 13_1_40CM_4_65_8]